MTDDHVTSTTNAIPGCHGAHPVQAAAIDAAVESETQVGNRDYDLLMGIKRRLFELDYLDNIDRAHLATCFADIALYLGGKPSCIP